MSCKKGSGDDPTGDPVPGILTSTRIPFMGRNCPGGQSVVAKSAGLRGDRRESCTSSFLSLILTRTLIT